MVRCIKELLEILPRIAIYVAVGFVFLKTFHFVALQQNTSDIDHILTASLVVGFIYCEVAYRIPFSVSYEIDHIGIIVSSACMGYLTGRLVLSKVWSKILDFLKIRNTVNMYYWDDLMSNDYVMKVYVNFTDKSYEGMLHFYEGYSNNPHVVLGSFIVRDSLNNVIKDFSNDCTKVAVLDTSKADSIYIEYHPMSNKSRDIESLCDTRREREKQEENKKQTLIRTK